MSAPVLAIAGLGVEIARQEAAPIAITRDVDLELHAGRTVALVGERGCGKSSSALAVMNLLVAFMTTQEFSSICAAIAPDTSQLVARIVTPKFWSVYALVAPATAQLALLTAQYFMFRKQIAGRIRARALAQTV